MNGARTKSNIKNNVNKNTENKSKVSSERLKTARDGLRRIASGRLFQARGAATAKCSREALFFYAFSGLRSRSIALSHVWLGLPRGRFQSDGGWRIAAVAAHWWSSLGALRAMWP